MGTFILHKTILVHGMMYVFMCIYIYECTRVCVCEISIWIAAFHNFTILNMELIVMKAYQMLQMQEGTWWDFFVFKTIIVCTHPRWNPLPSTFEVVCSSFTLPETDWFANDRWWKSDWLAINVSDSSLNFFLLLLKLLVSML